MADNSTIYVSVILPLKYRGGATYIVPEHLVGDVVAGSRVKVDFAGKVYSAVVESISSVLSGDSPANALSDSHEELSSCAESALLGTAKGLSGREILYKEILAVEPYPPVSINEIRLWHEVADYYLCSIGEVYKAAYPSMAIRQEQVKSRKTAASFYENLQNGECGYKLPELSSLQQEVLESIGVGFAANGKKRPVLLHGVTGSGKTEIYMHLACEQLKLGRSVLYMAPEIAITRQLQTRLKALFGERLLIFHSKQSAVEKKRIHKIVSGEYLKDYEKQTGPVAGNDAVVVLGTRSALFLPYGKLGLVIVDEEHDPSYKQTEPSPRYQARDVAVMLANIHGANVLLGSATPSFESLYNCMIGRFAKVELLEKYYGAQDTVVGVIDTIWARKSGQMRGNFSQKLINAIRKRVEEGKQVLVFKNRRSYAPVVECTECGETVKCPHCNVNLSYHRYNSTLRCHYCDYTVRFNPVCSKCGLESLKCRGAGTERLEEELKELLPGARIARFDADVTASKRAEEAVIKSFAAGVIDVLVGTQMISKGFDFRNLKLVAVIDADSLLSMQDFRADERALQMFSQLLGRAGRREEPGELLLQTNCKDHPVIKSFVEMNSKSALQGNMAGNVNLTAQMNLMEQRREFSFAPFVRMVKIIVKHSSKERLDLICDKVADSLGQIGALEVTGPFVPPVDKVRGEWLMAFYVKFARDRKLKEHKQKLMQSILGLKCGNSVIIDVDPL
ncbi:MAG: primosomal protein N' [Bacteroidales bacterium]|nr:primosomal protein N' [Bacteroidales bacterium]